MAREKPVRVIPHHHKHATETRVFAREIHEEYCVQPGCKFRGQHAAQGVCHTTKTLCDSPDWSYVDKAIAAGRDFIKGARKLYKGKDYVKYIEACMEAYWANEVFRLDELIRLRRENALMKARLERFAKKHK